MGMNEQFAEITIQELEEKWGRVPDWNDYNLAERDVEIIALFGEHIKLAPAVAARLTAKLATILCKIKYTDPLDEILWPENQEIKIIKIM